MDGTNKRLDAVTRDVEELKTSLKYTQDKCEEMRRGYKEIHSFENNIMNSKQVMDGMCTKLNYTENQCRRTNILI